MKKLAFTLIEILIVIVVIGIISSFIIVSVSSITQKATIAKGQAFSSSIKNAIMSNLVSEWRLDGNADEFWGGKNGTLVNSPTAATSCPQNTCYSFNGTNQYITIPDDPVFNFGTKMSAFVWVRGNVSGYFFAQNDGGTNQRSWSMSVDADISPYTGLRIILSDDGTNNAGHQRYYHSNDTVFDNKWHLVGFTWNNGTFLMYIDGQSVSYTTGGTITGSSLWNSTANLTISCQLSNSSPTNYFTGQIDEPRLYNESVPTSLIKQNYYSGINKLLSKNSITNNEYSERISVLRESLAKN